MVKHTQTIRRQIADELFVFGHFVGYALKGLTCMFGSSKISFWLLLSRSCFCYVLSLCSYLWKLFFLLFTDRRQLSRLVVHKFK